MLGLNMNNVWFQTQLLNGTYQQHAIEEAITSVFTSYNGIFRIEVPYENLETNCIPVITYEYLPHTYACSGKCVMSLAIDCVYKKTS